MSNASKGRFLARRTTPAWLLAAAMTAAAPAAQAQSLRPNILIIFDTSGSMLYGQSNDGSPLCSNNANGRTSRIYNLKEAMRAALAQAGADEANFGLMRFPQGENATITPSCPAGHYSMGANTGCRLTSHSSNQTTYGAWFDTDFRQSLLVDVTKKPAGTKPLASDFDPPDANLFAIFDWLDQTEDSDKVAPITDPEIRAVPYANTPLGRSLFYARMYFDNYIKPVDPKGSCRTNTVILVTDGDETCDNSGGGTLDPQTCTGGTFGTFHPYAQACKLLRTSNVRTYVVTDLGTGSANDIIASFGGTNQASRVSLSDQGAVKAALLGIIARTVPPTEICNGLDENCNGQTDEGVSNQCPFDATTLAHCKTESCNCLDDDCDGKTDEGLPPNACGAPCGCTVPTELCNAMDDDCDGDIDEGFDAGAPCNNGLLGSCYRAGLKMCTASGAGTSCQTEPVDMSQHEKEYCNGVDDDCNGLTDDGTVIGVGQPCGGGVGQCSAGTIICKDGKLVCNATSVSQPELCNGLDDDCNGLTDDGTPTIWPWLGGTCTCGHTPEQMATGECRPGTWVCKNEQVCEGCIEPSPEVCDGKDNDCDGVTDNGQNPCGNSRFRCSEGRCVLLCASDEFPCPSGYKCENDFCIPQRCNGVVCYPDEKCDDETGKCVDLCYGIKCTAPSTCDHGVCVTCYDPGYGCPEGQRCVAGTCRENRCTALTCSPDEYCADAGEASGARCVRYCETVQCGQGQRCVQGQCQDDPCAAMACDTYHYCDATQDPPACVPNPCAGRVCTGGKLCVPTTGRCAEDPCDSITCGDCFRCITTVDGQGTCVADDGCDARRISAGTRGSSGPGCSVAQARPSADAALWILVALMPRVIRRRRR